MTAASVVHVVDDDARVLLGIERLLGVHGIPSRTYQDPQKFLQELDPTSPGCILLDLLLPETTGIELHKRLRAAGAAQPVVFLSGHGTVEASVLAMKAGATDFLEKPISGDKLLEAVRAALARDDAQRLQRAGAAAISDRLATLTPREAEVLRHVIAGRLNKQIAARIGTAVKTVKVHRARVMSKMAVRSVAELTRMAMAVGIQPEP